MHAYRLHNEAMPTITIRDLPKALHDRLKERAARNRRSLNSEIVYCLEQVLSVAREEPGAYLDRIRPLRDKTGRLPLNDELLRAARDGGRP